jgi:PASTA domain
VLAKKSRLGRSAALACLVFGLAGLVSTSAARASSIVYTKGNNIWIANSDGSAQYQVTTDGTAGFAYAWPSEDNNGVIAAARGSQLVRMRQNGQILSSFQPATDYYSGVPMNTPLAPMISPDGSKIAYFYDSFACIIAGECTGRAISEVSDSNQATNPSVYGHVFDGHYPVWVTGSRLLMFGGYLETIRLFDLGASDAQVWVPCDTPSDPTCSGSYNTADDTEGVLSPQHDKLALVRKLSDGTTHLALYNVAGDPTSGSPPPDPTLICQTTDNDPTLSTLSFSPDGSQLIYSDSQGVWLMDIPATLNSDGSNCGSITVTTSPIIPGGSQARFGLPDNNPPPRSGGSGGKHACHVPNLIGKKLGAARTALSRANCKLGKVTKRHTRPKNRGRVLSERPSAGAVRSAGAKVNLVVGK